MNVNQQKAYDIYSGRLLCLFMILNALNLFIKQNLNIPFLTSHLSLFLGLVFLLFFLLRFRFFIPAFKYLFFLEILFIVLIISSVLRYSESTAEIIKRCLWVVVFCVPSFCLFVKVQDTKLAFSQIKLGCLVVLTVGLFDMIMHIKNRGDTTDYNMPISYALLLPTLFHFSGIKEKTRYLVLFALDLFVLLIYGSRGAILCIALYFIAILILKKSKTIIETVVKLVLSAAILCFVLFLDQLFALLSVLLKGLGIQSRTLALLASGRITTLAGRETVWGMILKRIVMKPWFGWGIAGDQSFMVSSPHQLFLELILDFGIPIGAILGLAVLFSILYKLVGTGLRERSILMMFCCGFVPLMLSGSYLDTVYFWILMALCLNPRVGDKHIVWSSR